uniref:B-cell receptor CD22-like n=1 Tax=Kryptolebias marmoratus TaxID=37003 RepID=A0A3Q3BG57_KRYMA
MEKWILIILVLMPGVWSGNWGVSLENQCALKGSSVVVKCEYDYPFGNFVTSVKWSKAQFVSGKWSLISVSKLSSTPDHFNYIGNHRGDCKLKVNNVQSVDEGAYFFSFVTTLNKWRSKRYAYLTVKELTAVVQPSNVTEGDTVRLTCSPGCPGFTEFIWFKDGRRVWRTSFQVSREDAGRYYCAVLGQEVTSAPVVLTVRYAPKAVTLTASPSGPVIKGSTVTLTCGSDANPPVTQSGYSLYKGGEFISSGQNHIIPDIQPSESGWYHCRAGNGISWGGSDLKNSSEIHLDVLYGPTNVSVSVYPHHIVEGSSVNLTCSGAANPAADNYTWFKRTGVPGSSSMVQVGSGQVLSLPSIEASHRGLYMCHVGNRLGENNSTEVMLAVVEEPNGSQPLPLLAGVGVSLFVLLGIALLLFWKKKRYRAEKEVSP